MSGNAFSVGKDISFVLVGPTGAIALPKITSFQAEPQYETFKSKPLDGATRQFDLPDGWTGNIKYDREDAAMDVFSTGIEAAYWAAGGFVPEFTGYQYITERSGSQTVLQFSEMTIKFKAGDWKPGSPVSEEIQFYARYRRMIGS